MQLLGPPFSVWCLVENLNLYIYLYIYIYIYICIVPSDEVSSSKTSRRDSRGLSDLLGILVSAGLTRIIGVLFHGTSCRFRVQFVLTHETLTILVMWFTTAAHFVPSCAITRKLSRSFSCVKFGVPTIRFIFSLVYDRYSSRSMVMRDVFWAPAYIILLVLPMVFLKYWAIALFAGVSGSSRKICPSKVHLRSVISTDTGILSVCVYINI